MQSGRLRQKQRTEAAMIAAARQLFSEGVTPTVEQAAERAGVSRATAYRYFVNQRLLIAAAHPETETPSLLPDDPPEDPVERVALVAAEIMRITIEHETEYRAVLRMSLERADQDLPMRKGRRIRWFEDALTALSAEIGDDGVRRLSITLGAVVGIEPLVWLTDVARLSRSAASDVLVTTARTLARDALANMGPTAPPPQ